eukprot:TRINITY_DN1140_c0_g3_i2.p1 TRINITY_DN1140_c0_g3~~TRINITY_DN1140_c0_g3_i2.p1  ORF type:complete len:850 (+),score=60.90 TRINITY_DN1140_c0_g3_i2:561-3110(+)
MKLAELDDQSRGVVMLSRTMQQKESQKADIPLEVSSILRPVVRWTWEDGGWAIDQDDDDDLHLILSYSPYHTEVEVMKAFDTLGSRNCRTHLVLHDLRPEIEIQDSNRDVKLNDAPSGCWAAKRSLRELLSLLYPTGFELPEVQRTRFELLGTPVVPVDLGLKSSRWMSRVVELKPQDEVSNGKSKKVRNDTPFTLRVGFVQDRNHLRMASRGGGVDTQQFCEGPQNLLQGFTVIKGQRVGQMPVPSVPPRCGNIVGHFKSGIGALMIAHIPKGNADVRAAPSKQEFEREAHETLETLRTMAVRVCSILFEELNATPKRKSPEIDIYDIPEPGRPARTRAVQSQIGSQMNAPLAATEATRGAQRGNPKRRKRANALPSSHAVAQNQAAPASWDNDAIVRWYASLLPSWGELGNVVWTKQQGSWWPAVLRAHRRQPRPGYVWIMNLYKPTEFAEVRPNEITPYHIPQHSNRKEGLGIKPTDRKKFDAALETAEDLELVSCVCGQQGAGADGLIGCDQCGRWLHSGCVGPEAAEQDSYVCWRCTGQQIQEFHGGPEVQQSRIDFLVDAIQQLKDTRRGSGNAALHMCEVWLHELKTQLARNRSAPCSSAQRNEPAAQPPLPASLQSIPAAQPQSLFSSGQAGLDMHLRRCPQKKGGWRKGRGNRKHGKEATRPAEGEGADLRPPAPAARTPPLAAAPHRVGPIPNTEPLDESPQQSLRRSARRLPFLKRERENNGDGNTSQEVASSFLANVQRGSSGWEAGKPGSALTAQQGMTLPDGTQIEVFCPGWKFQGDEWCPARLGNFKFLDEDDGMHYVIEVVFSSAGRGYAHDLDMNDLEHVRTLRWPKKVLVH